MLHIQMKTIRQQETILVKTNKTIIVYIFEIEKDIFSLTFSSAKMVSMVSPDNEPWCLQV